MVTQYGIGIPAIRTRRHPGDLRWPARRVAAGLALYILAVWLLVASVVTALL